MEANLAFTCRKDGEYIGNEFVTKAKTAGVAKKYAFFTLEEKVNLILLMKYLCFIFFTD